MATDDELRELHHFETEQENARLRAHRWDFLWAERAGEITLICACGLLWKHLPFPAGGMHLPACPAGAPD